MSKFFAVVSMLLLAGAGLFARSLFNLKSIDPGFRVENLIAFSVDPSLSGYDSARTLNYFERMQQELAALPQSGCLIATEVDVPGLPVNFVSV